MAVFSIIIPTFNRPDYLRRILSYYDIFQGNFTIIVADSSSDENKKLNKSVIASVSNLKIRYLDHYSPEIVSHHKFADAVNYAETEYCLFCADDDFVTPNGIKKSVDFLEKNGDFVVAHGRYISLRIEKSKRRKPRFIWRAAYATESIRFPAAEERLTYHLSNYFLPTIYGVHRADILKMAYQELLRCHVSPILFGELLPSILTLIHGKMECSDMLYMVRTQHTAPHWPMDLRGAVAADIYNEEYAKFRECLAAHLSRKSNLDIGEANQVVDSAMSAYMKKHYAPQSSQRHLLDSLNLPDWANKGIVRSSAALAGLRYNRKAIKASLSSRDHDDLDKIRLHILSSLDTSTE